MATKNWLTHPVFATAIGINAFVLALALAAAGADPAPLGRLLEEDRLAEWMQFLSFSVIAVLIGFVAVDRARRGPFLRLEVLALFGLSALVALAALEEISWFQRVLAVESPDFFRQHNKQAETNLHNLAMGGASLHKVVLLKLIFIVGITHNLVLPLLARSRPGIRRFVESIGLYLPPLSVSLVYLLLVILSHTLLTHPRQGELGEMFGAVHYLATAFGAYYLGINYDKPKMIEGVADGKRIARLFAALMIFLLFTSWLLSAMSRVPAA